MIKGILIDIDNTLYDYESTHKIAMEAVLKEADKHFNKTEFLTNFNIARKQIHNELKNTASSHNRLLYFQRTLELLNNNDFIIAKKLYNTYWETFIENIKLFDGVIEFLENYKHLKICFLTDLTADIQYKKIEKLQLNKYAKYLVTSEEIGVEKPNKKMFNSALKKMKLKNNEVCMIGDSYEKDILGAINVSIKPYWKTEDNNQNTKVETFNDFNELIGKI